MGSRCADHVTPLHPQKLALTSPTGGGRSVGIVRVRTKATEFVCCYGGEISFTQCWWACVQMVKNHVYRMCFPVCLWQYSVRAESVHARSVWHSASTTGKKIQHRRTKNGPRPTAPHWHEPTQHVHYIVIDKQENPCYIQSSLPSEHTPTKLCKRYLVPLPTLILIIVLCYILSL